MPFRWRIDRIETVGALIDDSDDDTDGAFRGTTYRTPYHGFVDDLLACTARTVALAGESDLVFVGRAPESLYDLISGLTAGTSRGRGGAPRLTLLRYSVGHTDSAADRRNQPAVLAAYRTYLDTIGLSPAKLIVRERPVALVDLINWGTTMRELLRLIYGWTQEERADWPAVRRKIRVVGITQRNDADPPRPRWRRRRDGYSNWTWRSEADWRDAYLEHGAFREVAVSSQLWEFLGDWQAKTTPPYSPDEWGTDAAARPSHEAWHLAALRAARNLYDVGGRAETRRRFAALLANDDVAMRSAWCRHLIVDMNGR